MHMKASTAVDAHDASPQRRAIGIVRVSQTKGREGERFASPEEQRERIETACARDGLSLTRVYEEMDVSGGKPLDERPGLSAAVAAIEAGKADVIAAGYFDRLFRSLGTQAEVVERVERAGGQVLAVDVGQVTGGSAGQWLSGTMMGAVSEYFRRSAKERSAEGQARAVARGAIPFARVPLGYQRKDDGTLEIDPETAPLARRAFEMRAEGQSAMKIREWLASHGVKRSPGGVSKMFQTRIYLGEITYGNLHNLNAHEPLIDRELWERVNRMVIPRGRQPGSDRLLARLKIMRCGSCGGYLGTMKLPKQNNLPVYRCPSSNDCPCHVTINAEMAEEFVENAVREALKDAEGRASAAQNAKEALQALKTAQAALDAAVRSFDAAGLATEASAIEHLADLRQRRDTAQERVDQMGESADKTITLTGDWDDLTRDEKRALIRATIARVDVAPAGPRRRWDGGVGRLSIKFVG